jgi:signal transduction histidine kinase
VEQARVLVLSNDREFIDAIAWSWRRLRYSPEFVVAGTGAAGELAGCVVVLTDDVTALRHLPAGVVLAMVIPPEATASARGFEADGPEAERGTRVVWMQRSSAWPELAAALAQETVLRLQAQAQAAEARQRLREGERYAALGRFIAEARHGLGNALTGVLGNSELLLLETGKQLLGETRAQVETIHAMSLKIHETFHRLSSLDMELRLAERQAERETQCRPVQ